MTFRALGRLRAPIRAAFFRVLEQALATDDGRRALAGSLGGLLASGTRTNEWAADALPYPDLGRRDATRAGPPPIFVTARFRSGSTLLWNLFRHVPGCTSYYEPLNERRWFDPATRGGRVDATHLGVADYWREYETLPHLGQWYRTRWTSRDLFMDPAHGDPDLVAYIDAMIAAAPLRAVLQFNRVDFRLGWLRRHFPQARLIHLYRHPRDQWCSTLVEPERVPLAITPGEFAAYDRFYLLSWARDLSYRLPFLEPRRSEHPYDLFYMVWKLSWLCGTHHADASIGYEQLCTHPERELPRVLRAAGIAESVPAAVHLLIGRPAVGTSSRYAPPEWFAAREARCERILERALGSASVHDLRPYEVAS